MAYTGSSIVDYLGSTGQASDYASRAKLATANGITGYAGTAEQNTQLLNALRAGSNPSATTPKDTYVSKVATVSSIPNTATPTAQYSSPIGPTMPSSFFSTPQVGSFNTGVQSSTPSTLPAIESWNLSNWQTNGSGSFTKSPVLTINGNPTTYTSPTDAMSALTGIASQGATGDIAKYISEFQNVLPEFKPVAPGVSQTPSASVATPQTPSSGYSTTPTAANPVAQSSGVQYGPFQPTVPAPVASYKPATPKDTFVNSQVTTPATPVTGNVGTTSAPGTRNVVTTAAPGYTGTPVAPGPSAADAAFAEYLKSLMPSAEETEAQRYLNTLNTDANLANERALNSGETMGFAGGEAQRVGRNNDIRIAGQSARLQQIQGNRANMTAAQKARLDYEQGKEKAAASANPAFELSPGQERWTYNAKTGKYEMTASAPKDPLDAAYKQAQIDNLYADNARQESGGTMTATERKAEKYSNTVSAINTLLDPARHETFGQGTPYIDNKGYLTQKGFTEILRDAQAHGMSRADFLKEFGSYLGSSDGNGFQGYGLTQKEINTLLDY